MSHERSGGKTREQLLGEIEELKEKVRRLQHGGDAAGQTQGLAQGIAAALGNIIPGLGGLIHTASQMPEVQKRLAAIDEEVKRKFQQQPLDRAAVGLVSGSRGRQMGIPPSIRRPPSTRPGSTGAGAGQPSAKAAPRGKYRQPQPPKVHISPETPTQLPVDVFDEGGRIVVLAEAPGLAIEDFRVSLDGTVLLLSVEAPQRRGSQRIELPCEVAGRIETSLANGILSIQIQKKGRQ
jgi:HSP20 family molecular chaperone IbpA